MRSLTVTLDSSARRGMTLLEVLVASGILVVGLSSVAAILPAAASLLGEAANIDRATMLAANTAADVKARGVRTAEFAAGVKTLVSGDLFAPSAFVAPTFRKAQPPLGTAPDEQVYGRLDYAIAVTPLPNAGQVFAGMPVRLTVAVFRKADGPASGDTIPLGAVGGGVYKLSGATADADRKRHFRGGSWVLVKNGDAIHWLHVNGSWKVVDDCFVAFTDADAATAAGGANLNVYRFNPILCLYETLVSLD